MAKTQVEVITTVERRRRWSAAEKERLVAASLEAGAVGSALAREAGLHPSQLYKWRRQLCARPGALAGQRMRPRGECIRRIGSIIGAARGVIERSDDEP